MPKVRTSLERSSDRHPYRVSERLPTIYWVLTRIDEQRTRQRTIHGTAESDREYARLPGGSGRAGSSQPNDC